MKIGPRSDNFSPRGFQCAGLVKQLRGCRFENVLALVPVGMHPLSTVVYGATEFKLEFATPLLHFCIPIKRG